MEGGRWSLWIDCKLVWIAMDFFCFVTPTPRYEFLYSLFFEHRKIWVLLSLFFPAETFGLPSSLPVEHESAAGSFLSSGAEFGPGVLRLIPSSCSLSSSAAECASCISVSLPSPIAFLVYHSRFSVGSPLRLADLAPRQFIAHVIFLLVRSSHLTLKFSPFLCQAAPWVLFPPGQSSLWVYTVISLFLIADSVFAPCFIGLQSYLSSAYRFCSCLCTCVAVRTHFLHCQSDPVACDSRSCCDSVCCKWSPVLFLSYRIKKLEVS
jgi:hypothetical protein